MTQAETFTFVHDDYVPSLRSDVKFRDFGNEAVAWASSGSKPVYLDPVARIVAQILDGAATVRDLIDDVHDVLSIDIDVAGQQIRRVIHLFRGCGMLTDSAAAAISASDLELFTDPPND